MSITEKEEFKVADLMIGNIKTKLDDLKSLDIFQPAQLTDISRTLDAMLRKSKLEAEKKARREKLMEEGSL